MRVDEAGVAGEHVVIGDVVVLRERSIVLDLRHERIPELVDLLGREVMPSGSR